MRTLHSEYNDAPPHAVKIAFTAGSSPGGDVDLRAYSRPGVASADVTDGFACWSIELDTPVDVVLLMEDGVEVTIPSEFWAAGQEKLKAAVKILAEGTAGGPSAGDSTGSTNFIVSYRNN
jgi:hypothetical protein